MLADTDKNIRKVEKVSVHKNARNPHVRAWWSTAVRAFVLGEDPFDVNR